VRGLRRARARSGFFVRGCARVYPMGIAPKPLGDPGGVGREPLISRLNILIC
jgi:hypothetical protein